MVYNHFCLVEFKHFLSVFFHHRSLLYSLSQAHSFSLYSMPNLIRWSERPQRIQQLRLRWILLLIQLRWFLFQMPSQDPRRSAALSWSFTDALSSATLTSFLSLLCSFSSARNRFSLFPKVPMNLVFIFFMPTFPVPRFLKVRISCLNRMS